GSERICEGKASGKASDSQILGLCPAIPAAQRQETYARKLAPVARIFCAASRMLSRRSFSNSAGDRASSSSCEGGSWCSDPDFWSPNKATFLKTSFSSLLIVSQRSKRRDTVT